jgi:hypothetical protein
MLLSFFKKTSAYEISDTRRFNLGTPDEVASALRRSWSMEPTSSRIVEDILAFPRVLEKLVAAKGFIVPDEALRRLRSWSSRCTYVQRDSVYVGTRLNFRGNVRSTCANAFYRLTYVQT